MATRLILIRHGITEWNIKKRYCGFMDIALSEKGRKQAQLLREKINRARKPIHKIYCSDRKRAMQTARIVFGNAPIKKIANLREMHFGIFEGLTHKQIMKKHAAIYKKWLSDPFTSVIPQGERLSGFKKRVKSALDKIIRANRNKTIAVVSHGGAISIFLTDILKTRDFWKNIPGATSLTIIEYKNNKPRILALNDTGHLHE